MERLRRECSFVFIKFQNGFIGFHFGRWRVSRLKGEGFRYKSLFLSDIDCDRLRDLFLKSDQAGRFQIAFVNVSPYLSICFLIEQLGRHLELPRFIAHAAID